MLHDQVTTQRLRLFMFEAACSSDMSSFLRTHLIRIAFCSLSSHASPRRSADPNTSIRPLQIFSEACWGMPRARFAADVMSSDIAMMHAFCGCAADPDVSRGNAGGCTLSEHPFGYTNSVHVAALSTCASKP